MNTLQEDVVDNFILDLLPPSTNNISTIKQKCITQLKRRIIRVDAIQRHCLNLTTQLNNKDKQLEETTKKLEYTQQDYKQTSLEYQEILESSTKHEKENEQLRAALEKLQKDHLMVITQLEARQSHIVQLEQLLKEVEKHDPKKIDKIIEDKVSAAVKEKEKERLLWKKKYESLQKKMKDKEKKINTEQVQQYDKQRNPNTCDSLSFDGHSDMEDNTSVELLAQIIDKEISQNTSHLDKNSPITSKEQMLLEDFCNELVSIDTGCGSSLASSDNEKWLNSPDYIFSPICGDNIENNRGRKFANVASSPIIFNENKATGTSPIPTVDMIDAGTNTILVTKDAATSPVPSVDTIDVGTETILLKKADTATSPIPAQDQTAKSSKHLTMNNGVVTSNKSHILRSGSVSPVSNGTAENIISKVVEEKTSTAYDPVVSLENACGTDIKESMGNANTCTDSIFVDNSNLIQNTIESLSIHGSISNEDVLQNEFFMLRSRSVSPLSFASENDAEENVSYAHSPITFSECDKDIHESKNNENTCADNIDVNSKNPIPYATETSAKNVTINIGAVTPIKSFTFGLESASCLNNAIDKNVTEMDVQENASTAHSLPVLSENASDKNTQENTVSKTSNNDDAIAVQKPAKSIENTTTQVHIYDHKGVKIGSNIPVVEDPNSHEITDVIHSKIAKGENSLENRNMVNQIQETPEKELLHLNNSKEMDVDGELDNEIEVILDTMRFNRKLLTPIPRTPGRFVCNSASKKSRDALRDEVTQTFCQEAAIARDQAAAAKEEAISAREYAGKLKAEHLKLMTCFKKIQKDMIDIKTFLKKRLSWVDDGDLEEIDVLPKFRKYFGSDQKLTDKNSHDSLTGRDNEIKPSNLETQSLLIDNNDTPDQLQNPSLKFGSDSNSETSQDLPSVPKNMSSIKGLQDNFTRRNHSMSILPNLGEDISSESLQDSSPNLDCNSNKSQNQSFVNDNKTSSAQLQDPLSRLGKDTNTEHLQDPESPSKRLVWSNSRTIGLCDLFITPKKSRFEQLQDNSPHPGITSKSKLDQIQESVQESNVDMSQTFSEQTRDSGIKIISETVLKPVDLDKVKNKTDFMTLVAKSEQKQFETLPDLQLDIPNKKEDNNLSPENNSTTKRPKGKKLSNLDKYRKRCEQPKYKIKMDTPIKPIKKPKQLQVNFKQLTSFDTAATLNDKNIYENAVKVMAQLNAKSSKKIVKPKAEEIEDVQPKEKIDGNIIAPTSNDIIPKRITRMRSADLFKQTENTPQKIAGISPSKLHISSPTPVSKSAIITRSRKVSGHDTFASENVLNSTINNCKTPEKDIIMDSPMSNISRKRKLSYDSSDTTPKRVLRNSPRINTEECNTDQEMPPPPRKTETAKCRDVGPEESILCFMIQKYGQKSKKQRSRNVNDADAKIVCEMFNLFMSEEKKITSKENRDELLEELCNYNCKDFLGGLMQYMNNADRKCELYSKISIPPQMEITKSEAVLMYVIKQLRSNWQPVDLVAAVLSNIEYILFRLNKTPTFDVVDAMSHFYAVLCRLSDNRDRLITFMLDAMYCIQYKSIGLIKQCLEAWPHIIPLAHMSKAKTPLMTFFVYLLHFFKCEDSKFNTVQDIRNILHRKYYYEATQWNEKNILELLKNSIRELKEREHEKKMLRIALIVFGKRHGPAWTHTHIIKNILLPFIERENVSNYTKVFCIELLGPLLKPYPHDMKMHCELALDRLSAILKTAKSKHIAEAAMYSIVLLSRHNSDRVAEILLSHKMDSLSPKLEELIRDYVRTKCLNVWLKTLPKIGNNNYKVVTN